jgi:hypothetical protein
MKGYWDQLRPLEKRLVVGVGTVLFIVLNAWFVWPHFSDWDRVKMRMAKAEETLNMFQTNVAQKSVIQAKVTKLSATGADVALEDQGTHLENTILSEQAKLGISPGPSGRITPKPTQFFVELSKNLSVQCREQQLVDFLYNLGTGNSMIRVRSLTLRADPSHQQLAANITFVASYQKKPVSRTTSSTSTSQPAKPASTTTPTTTKTTNASPAIAKSKGPNPQDRQSPPPSKSPTPATKKL